MGFLDNAANSIILDTVLTDTGRQFLSRNDGSFSIAKFALGDDEVNYNIIRRYGRAVGKEKIEKTTPVFEGLTLASQALKYKLVSVSNPNLTRLPSFTLAGSSVSSNVVTLGRTNQKTATLTVEQTIQNETSIDVELRDQAFIIDVPNLFLQIQQQVPQNIDSLQRATYIMSRSPNENAFGGSTLTFTIAVKTLSDVQFTTYGNTTNKNLINTYIRVSGMQSGAVKEFTVTINKGL